MREAGIPIHIRNTHRPEDPGTLIVPEQTERKGTIVTGIAGKKDFRVINVEKTRLREEGDFLRKLISVFESNEVPIENMPSCIDSVSVIVSQADISGKERKILEEIRIYCSPDALVSMPSIALIAVVGQGMIHAAGSAARVFRALGDDKVNIRLISQGSSELNILIGVDGQDFENAIRAIYKAFGRRKHENVHVAARRYWPGSTILQVLAERIPVGTLTPLASSVQPGIKLPGRGRNTPWALSPSHV